MVCSNARSKAPSRSSTSTSRAMSMKRLCCSGSSGLRGFLSAISFSLLQCLGSVRWRICHLLFHAFDEIPQKLRHVFSAWRRKSCGHSRLLEKRQHRHQPQRLARLSCHTTGGSEGVFAMANVPPYELWWIDNVTRRRFCLGARPETTQVEQQDQNGGSLRDGWI